MKGNSLRDAFLTGLIVVGPLAITVLAVRVVYDWLLSLTNPILSVIPGPTGFLSEFVSVILVLTGILLIGLLASRDSGYAAIIHLDRIMEKIPVLNVIYTGVRQASEVLATTEESQLERVVLVEWPHEGTFSLGFITSEAPEEIAAAAGEYADAEFGGEDDDDGEPLYNILIPLSPNPMTGFFAIVPESRVVMTDLSVREGIQLAVTTGLSASENAADDQTPQVFTGGFGTDSDRGQSGDASADDD